MNVMKLCGFCQQPAELLCGRCLEVYCSMDCQIRDWADHKRVCIALPKLLRNDNYLEILGRGLSLPLKVGQVSSGAHVNNSRSLKPMRKPNVPIGTVEISVGRDPTSELVEASVTEHSQPAPTAPKPTEEARSDPPNQTTKSDEPKKQSLAKLKLDIIKNHQQRGAPTGVDPPANGTAAGAAQPTKPWLLHFPLDTEIGEWFKVIVQCIAPEQGPKRAWVMLAQNEAQSDKLLRDIHGQLNPKAEPIKYDQIQEDDIFAAPYEGIYYRVVVLQKTNPSKSLIKVRLIDYGNELIIPSTELRAPLLLMKNLRAFAFLVEIANLDRKLDVGEHIRIKIVRSEADRKIVDIDLLPLNATVIGLFAESNEKNGEGGIIAIISSRVALVMLSSTNVKPFMKILFNQLPEAAAKFPQPENPKVGDVVCVDVAGAGWSRAVIIEQHEGHHLVYTIDNGTVELVLKGNEIRTLPDEYSSKPRLVLQMTIKKVLMNEQEFKRICYLPSFAFSFEQVAANKDQHSIQALMKDVDGKRQLAEVEFKEFACDLKQVDINYWPHIPQDNAIVRITSVLDVGTVITCPHDKIDIYTELLQTVLPKLTKLSAAPPNNLIVVGLIDNTMPYRARVLKSASPSEVEVLDLDNGSIKQVPHGSLYAANAFVCNLPVYPIKVQIRDLDVASIKDKKLVINQLMAMKSDKRKIKLTFEGQSYMCGVKLIDVTTNRSLAVILMELHDKAIREAEDAERTKREQQQEEARQKAAAEAHAKAEKERLAREAEEAARQKAAAEEAARQKAAAEEARVKAEQERLEREQREAAEKAKREEEAQRKKDEALAKANTKLAIGDLKLVELPVGKNEVKLSILDDGDLKHGVLTVCEFNDGNLKRYTKLNEDVNKMATSIGGDSYSPEVDELCVGIFDEDKLWYRAVCLQAKPDKDQFVVQFVDYGNVAVLNRQSIRKLSKELNFPCAAHTCTVQVLEKTVEKLAQQQGTLGYVTATEISKQDDLYTLKF